MKTVYSTCLVLVLVTTIAAFAHERSEGGQQGPPPSHPQGGERGPRPGPHHRPPPPVVVALDADRDGVINATEIANAAQSLLQLDANHDGQLSHDELRPPHHGGP